jgi:methionyl-tRNA formyltransferase
MGAHMAVAGVQQALDQALQPIPQPNDGITYAAKISKAESTLSFDRPAAQVLAHVHGLSPFPGACVVLNGERIKILQATVQPTPHTYAPGTVVDDQLGLACADGILRPIMVQRAGKKPMLLQECLRGYAPPVGTVA